MDIFGWLNRFGIGLHDAEVHRLTIDYPRRTASLDLEVWVQDDEMHGSDVDMYRPALVMFGGLEYCAIEPPDPRYPYGTDRSLRIDVDRLPEEDSRYPVPRSASGFRCRVFVNEWNAFVVICAETLDVAWLGEAHDGAARPG